VLLAHEVCPFAMELADKTIKLLKRDEWADHPQNVLQDALHLDSQRNM
jgi:hypothetical protein